MVNSSINCTNTNFEARSSSSILNQLLRYWTAIKASPGFCFELRIRMIGTTPGTSCPVSKPGKALCWDTSSVGTATCAAIFFIKSMIGRDVFGTKRNDSGLVFVWELFDIESNGA